jgi:Domain of unknown function (DUF1998)
MSEDALANGLGVEQNDGETAQVIAESDVIDPFAGLEDARPKNFGRIGTVRPTALLYTSGIGATVDLPHVAVMPQGLDAWDRAYAALSGGPNLVNERRLLDAVRAELGQQVSELRQPPHEHTGFGELPRVGVPVAMFPRWLRCTGCDTLAPFLGAQGTFTFVNTNKYRPDQARFVHRDCPGKARAAKGKKGRRIREAMAVPSRYLIACIDGHLDEFPYVAYVHRAEGSTWKCPKVPGTPPLRMVEWRSNLGPEVRIECVSCEAKRTMRELTGTGREDRLPHCRGRHPHLGTFQKCEAETRLMLLGAANQWFPAGIRLLVVPESTAGSLDEVVESLRNLPSDQLVTITRESLPTFRAFSPTGRDLADVSDDDLWNAIEQIRRGNSDAEAARTTPYEPVELLEPEWTTLVRPHEFVNHARKRDFRIRPVGVSPRLSSVVQQVVAVDRLKRVNAFIGFTRVDAFDRIGDARERVAPLCRDGRPRWVPATEDLGEGVFVQLREELVRPWEEAVLATDLWEHHRAAHERNFRRRTSVSARVVDPDSRFPPPRYWALHTLAHVLIRRMAMDSGYGSASLTERIYAWRDDAAGSSAAGLLISTTSPDSEGTLGGLVELSDPDKLAHLFRAALLHAQRCSSDPICAHRFPRGEEDFLHGAACHFCTFVSETTCERANRFLDRRFVLDTGGYSVSGLVQGVLDRWDD